jgi:hypothetical protein
MLNEFQKGLRQIQLLHLGIDDNEKLYRSQGVMFSLMFNNQKLQSMLKAEFLRNKNDLPFILINSKEIRNNTTNKKN